MQGLDRFDPTAFFDTGGMEIKFKDQPVCLRDSVLICYYLLRDSDLHEGVPTSEVFRFLERTGEAIGAGCLEYQDEVWWLWLLGEYMSRESGIGLPEFLSELAALVVSHIESRWQEPFQDWMGEREEGIYLTNMAMAYGALRSSGSSLKDPRAQQCMLEIRDLMFRKFLRGGQVVSKLGSEDIYGDISLISVPFALLDAGNQILAETMKVLERELLSRGVRYSKSDTYFGGCTRSDLTCLLSWYFSEKGDRGRAKWLLEGMETQWRRDGKLYSLDLESRREEMYYAYWRSKVEEEDLERPLSYILYAIARQNIQLRERQKSGQAAGVQISHTAVGLCNPYLFPVTERFPRHPEEHQNVVLKMVTEPMEESQSAFALFSVNDGELEKAGMRKCVSPDGERYWEAAIGSFLYGDRVTYRFEVHNGVTCVESENFDFQVRKWHRLSEILEVSDKENGLEVLFKPVGEDSGMLSLKIMTANGNVVKWTISCMQENSEISPMGRQGQENSSGVAERDSFKLDYRTPSFCLKDQRGKKLLATYPWMDPGFIDVLLDGSGKVRKIRLSLELKPDERIFGMGERFSHLEFRGQNVDQYVYNQYRDQGHRTYIPVPFMLSSAGYGLFLDTPFYSRFEFGTRLSDLTVIESDLDDKVQDLDIYLLQGSPKAMLACFSQITGKAQLPPKWVFGLWMSSNNWDSQEEVEKQLALAEKFEIPASVLVLEQWSDEATFYIFNDAQYEVKDGNGSLDYGDFAFPAWGRWPDPREMTRRIHEAGMKLLLWQTSVMKYMDGIAHGQRDEDERAMLSRGFHIRKSNGEPYRVPDFEWFKRSLVPDFTNSDAREWWLDKRRYLVEDIGIDGFKTDGGECVFGEDLVLQDGTPSKAIRNLYPNLYIQSFYQYIRSRKEGITFSRAGYTGAQKTPLHWAGDERSTFQAFAASVRAGLSCSLSGIPFWGWDIAGFHGGIPTAELYLRSVEMAAFCPVMQYHAESKGEFNQDRTPWNIAERTGDDRVIPVFKRYADLRMNLLPYLYDQARKTSESGIPMMRAMFLEYPEDPRCTSLWQQYMFGDCLLVAPVLEEGSTVKDVYLPEGDWMELFRGEKVHGPRLIRVKADMDEIPVFIRGNSVIPLNLPDNYIFSGSVSNKLDDYINLCFLVFVSEGVLETFSDDRSGRVRFDISKTGDHIFIDLESGIDGITLAILGQEPGAFEGYGGPLDVTMNGEAIPEVSVLADLGENSCCRDGQRILIKVGSKGEKVRIEVGLRDQFMSEINIK